MLTGRRIFGGFLGACLVGAALCAPICAATSTDRTATQAQKSVHHCEKHSSSQGEKHCSGHIPVLLKAADAVPTIAPIIAIQALPIVFEVKRWETCSLIGVQSRPPDKVPLFIQLRAILI